MGEETLTAMSQSSCEYSLPGDYITQHICVFAMRGREDLV